MVQPFSPARWSTLAALALTLLALGFAPRLAWLPGVLLLAIGGLVPLFPCFPFYLPIVCHGDRTQPRVALSFDDGPDPAVTPRVLDLLERHEVPAAFFLVGTKADAHPELVRAILARGHEVGNHGWRHDTQVTLKGRRALAEEVDGGQRILQSLGGTPLAFRPPVGITNPHLRRILDERGMFCLNFSCRAWDAGNRRIRDLARRLLRKVRPGDVILLHDTAPHHAPVEALLAELEALLAGLEARSLEVVPVSTLVGRPIMVRHPLPERLPASE